MEAQLAGLFVKRVCIFGDPVPGVRPGSTRTPTLCEDEPTALLVAVVVMALVGLIVLAGVLIATRRRGPRPTLVPSDAASRPPSPPVGRPVQVAGDGHQAGRNWRDVYVRLLAYVDRAMADVGRTMPDDRAIPVRPQRFENEESGRLAAELGVLGSTGVHAAHTEWARTLFQFYLLARDVADASAQNLPEEQYSSEVTELRKTRTAVFERADALRRQASEELRG
jgi:hypothetical protein